MKTKLTPEQSQRLIELGVDPSKASMCQIQHSADGETIYRIVEHDEFCYEMSCLHPKPIFNLSDILSLLPKEICERINGIRYDCHLSMYGSNKTWGAMYRLDCGDDFLEAFDSPELIDALYELLCWVLKNHPGKINNQNNNQQQ